MVNVNLKGYYIPGEEVTVDEQLFPFRGRWGFFMYIPSKPARYRINIWCIKRLDYPLQGQLYTGMAASGIRDAGQG